MRGYIDEFYIFNKTLKEMEIKNLISKCSGEKSSVILHLAFEKDMGNISLDTSGLKNDASIMGLSPLLPSLGKGVFILTCIPKHVNGRKLFLNGRKFLLQKFSLKMF